MKKQQLLVAVLLASALLPQASQAQIIGKATPPAATLTETDLRALGEGIAFPYELLDNALKDNVDKEGKISYGKIKGSNDLETFVRAVAIADLSKFPKWMIPADPNDPKSVEEPDRTPELTFYINAYNALFLKAITDGYPVGSPTEIKNLDTAKTRTVAGKAYSFADLRKVIAELDPRALFALPDGTNGGPRAAGTAYRYTNLNAQLNGAVNSYINDITRVAPPVRLQNTVMVSPWLQSVDEWFVGKGRRSKWNGIKNVLMGYTTRNSDQRYFAAGDYQVVFMRPDNSINEALSSR